MRSGLYIVCLAFVVISAGMLQAQEVGGGRATSSALPGSPTALDTASLNINLITMCLNNRGSLPELRWALAGAVWHSPERLWGEPLAYDQGLWVIGNVEGEVRAAVVQWGSSYSPGPIIDGRPAMDVRPQDSLRYRPYKITRGDDAQSNPDYAEWPVDLGAPVDANGKPRVLGDQTIWMVYNGADTTRDWLDFDTPFPRLPIEVHQTAFAQAVADGDSTALPANVVFLEWTLVNKGNAQIDSAFVSLWTDIDIYDATLNLPGIDTTRALGYLWEGRMSYDSLGTAAGYVWLYGPRVASPGDTAFFRGRKAPGYRNLPITSFWGIADDSYPRDLLVLGAPSFAVWTAWNIARGLQLSGEPIVNPITNGVTTFTWSGDPVSGTGWIYSEWSGGGAGFNMFSGPFTLLPGDTQWVMVALVPARGKDRFDSIVKLREHAMTLHSMPYDSLAKPTLPADKPTPTTTTLLQNYPNPFNAGSRIEYTVSEPGRVSVQIFDILGRQIATLVDEDKTAGRFGTTFVPVNLPSGVYLCRLKTEHALSAKKLVLLK